MTAELGVYLLLFALIASVYATVAALVGRYRNRPSLVASARNALLLTWPLTTAACLLLISLLVGGSFNTEFVWSVTDTSMPTYLKITALWGGQAGSLVFWSWLMSTFVSIAVLHTYNRARHLMPIAIAVMAVTLGFFLLLVTFWENPFARFWQLPTGEVTPALFGVSGLLASISQGLINLGETLPGMLGVIFSGVIPLAAPGGAFPLNPPNGQGLNPLLRHPGMIIHPPMLYIGFVGFVVPFAFAVAALELGKVDDGWMNLTRRYTLVSWLFLGLGLILGGWWAYDVLGWGGYWAWDPVENAAFMPWLTGTAFLHSVMIQEKRGMLRRWNMILIISTYLLVVLGTFATRSGLVSSVHSFAQSAIGPLFFIFLAAAVIISVALLMRNWDALAADNKLESLLSRETAFLVNNLIFISITITVGVGTYWPVMTELLSTFTPVEKSSLGPAFYEGATGPMFGALLILMGIAPLVAWHRASLKRLGSAILWPVVATAVTVALLFVFGIQRVGPLVGIAIALFAGIITLFEYFRGAQARVRAHGESYPLALWKLFGRNRRRYGGYLIHLGVVIMAVGIIASSAYQLETQQRLSAGQTIEVGNYVMEYQTLERFMATDGRAVTRAVVDVYNTNGQFVDTLYPRVDGYPNGQPMSIPGKSMNFIGDDFYVLLINWERLDLSSATFKVYVNPLVNWIWGGGFVFILGTFVTVWPSPERRPIRLNQRVAAPVPAAGD